MAKDHIKVNRIAIMDCMNFQVYCRDCRRSATFWDQIKHTRRCQYAPIFHKMIEANNTLFDRHPTVTVTVPAQAP